jgi:hypothetical protein
MPRLLGPTSDTHRASSKWPRISDLRSPGTSSRVVAVRGSAPIRHTPQAYVLVKPAATR